MATDYGGAVGNIISGLISTAGSLYANSMSRKSARHAQQRQFAFAREQTERAIDLANTAHQREVADLRAAGLNPILSSGGSGAATPALQSADAVVPQIRNPVEGLANSASRVARLISEDYRSQIDNRDASTQLVEQSAKSQALQNEVNSANVAWRRQLDGQQLINDYMRANLEQTAIRNEYGISPIIDKDDNGNLTFGTWINDWDRYKSAVDLAREGLRSDLKVRANQNWRANLSSFVPFASPQALNNGASAVQRLSR